MTTRTEFGLTRTTCACFKCSVWCQHMPGFLVPSDLDRLIPEGVDPYCWAEEHLRASPGLRLTDPETRVTINIPSLVPAKAATGHCHWYVNGLCAVHDNSPFGCAYYKQCQQTSTQADKISWAGRHARAVAFEGEHLYAKLWTHLWKKGLRYTSSDTDRIAAFTRIRKREASAQTKLARQRRKAERQRRKKSRK